MAGLVVSHMRDHLGVEVRARCVPLGVEPVAGSNQGDRQQLKVTWKEVESGHTHQVTAPPTLQHGTIVHSVQLVILYLAISLSSPPQLPQDVYDTVLFATGELFVL